MGEPRGVAGAVTGAGAAGSPAGTVLSDELEACLKHDGVTLAQVNDVLDERGFALVLMLLLVPSALPVPTGGVTHLLELFGIVVVAQMILGRTEVWLPARVARHELGDTLRKKAAPKVLRFVRWFERHSRRRGAGPLQTRVGVSLLGIVLLVYVLGALLAPPFSGLDTLPSLGVVIVCLGLILGDVLIVAGGLVIGAVGVALVAILGLAAWSFL